MEERYIAAIDLGTSKTALTVASIIGEDIQIKYYKEFVSNGMRYSSVMNPLKVSEIIQKAVNDAQEALNIQILQVVVGLPRCDIRQEANSAVAYRSDADECISLEEIEFLKAQAQENYPNINPDTEALYGAAAQSFDCDDCIQNLESDIVGMISNTLTGNFKLFIGKKSGLRALDQSFNKAGIAIVKKYFTPDVLGNAVLTKTEREAGVALVDFGGGATSVTIYKGNVIRHYASIPFGGASITNDIKNECTITKELAENIKLGYGICLPDNLANLSEKIIQIEGEEGVLGLKQIPVRHLSDIITCRVREIFDAIMYEIQKSGLADSLRCGVVVTGGSANLCNLCTLIRDYYGYDARIGTPLKLFSASGCNGVYDPSATSSLGMILMARHDKSLNCSILNESPANNEDGFSVVNNDNEIIEEVNEKVETTEELISENTETVEEKPAENTQTKAEKITSKGKEEATTSQKTTVEHKKSILSKWLNKPIQWINNQYENNIK